MFLLLLFFLTRAANVITVSQDGTGNAKTISDALTLVPSGSSERFTIAINPGYYYEKVYVTADKGPITILGMSANRSLVSLYHDDAATGDGTPGCKADAGGEWDSQTLMIESNDIIVANITIANNACNYNHSTAGQSFAIQVIGDRASFYNVQILGAQDTLYTGAERSYFSGCRINGSVDSIFGIGAAVFDNCYIDITDHITAHKGDPTVNATYLIQYSHIAAPSYATPNSTELGRPWGQYAHVVYKSCVMDSFIVDYGWGDWGHNCTTAPDSWCANVFYAEYNSTGPGANPAARVPWSYQLSEDAANNITIESVLRGWTPPPPPSSPFSF